MNMIDFICISCLWLLPGVLRAGATAWGSKPFHANGSICYTCWCVRTYVWECMWILPTAFAFPTFLLRQMLRCDFLADSPALISTHSCFLSSDHSSLPVAGCWPIRSWNCSQFPGDPAVCVGPSSSQDQPGILPRVSRRGFSLLFWTSALRPPSWCPFYSSGSCALS